MRMRNARNSIPNVFHAKGWKKATLLLAGRGKTATAVQRTKRKKEEEKKKSRSRSSTEATTPGHIHMSCDGGAFCSDKQQ